MIGHSSIISHNILIDSAYQRCLYGRALRYLSLNSYGQDCILHYDTCIDRLGLYDELDDIEPLEQRMLSNIQEDLYDLDLQKESKISMLSRLQFLVDKPTWSRKDVESVLKILSVVSVSLQNDCAYFLNRMLITHCEDVIHNTKFWKAYLKCNGLERAEGRIRVLNDTTLSSDVSFKLFYARYIRQTSEHPFDQTISDFEACIKDVTLRPKALVYYAKYLDNRIQSLSNSSWDLVKNCLDLYLSAISVYRKIKTVIVPRILTLIILYYDRFAIYTAKYLPVLLNGLRHSIPYHVACFFNPRFGRAFF